MKRGRTGSSGDTEPLPEDQPLVRDERPPKDLDVPDPRAKNTGHKKKTADNWNQ